MIHAKTNCTLHAELNETVIRATHRPKDLIPAFIEVLKDTPEYVPFLDQIPAYASEDSEAEFWDGEEASYLLDELFETLNNYAPEGYYFGSHPGDGSDFGFWENESEITKEDFDNEFVETYLPIIREAYEQDGIRDIPARREAYNNLVDAYHRDGRINNTDASEWCLPDYLE